MNIRKLHKATGIILLLPFFGWSITGLVFFLKPGYQGAYELLQPKTYPMNEQISLMPDPAWLEFKYFRTIIGKHLIVRTSSGWKHFDPVTMALRKRPAVNEIRKLITDAISQHPDRYGQVSEVADQFVVTSSGIRITWNWDQLSLQQRGKDTDLIDRLYKIHYLQLTGVKSVDRVLGAVGLVLVTALSILGLLLALNIKMIGNHGRRSPGINPHIY